MGMELVMWWLRMVLKLRFSSESRSKEVSFEEICENSSAFERASMSFFVTYKIEHNE